jgi:hypothetical protein
VCVCGRGNVRQGKKRVLWDACGEGARGHAAAAATTTTTTTTSCTHNRVLKAEVGEKASQPQLARCQYPKKPRPLR